MRNSLFRKEVYASRKNFSYGTVLTNLPVSYGVAAMGIGMITLGILAFIGCAEFSEQFIVRGYIDSSKGLARVYTQRSGVILKIYHKTGDRVERGDKLLLLDTSEGIASETKKLKASILKRKALIEEVIRYKKEHLQSLARLLQKNFISRMEYDAKKEEFIELQNKKILMGIELARYKQSHTFVIQAPLAGRITNLLYQRGQYLPTDKPAMQILPKHSQFIARLLIPSNQIDSVHKNNRIIIRYDAYPFERYGSYSAVIREVTENVVLDREDEKPFQAGKPYYRGTATLANQGLNIAGKEKSLRQGMLLTAVIGGPKRRIWQWIFEPIYAFYGRMKHG